VLFVKRTFYIILTEVTNVDVLRAHTFIIRNYYFYDQYIKRLVTVADNGALCVLMYV